MTKIEIKPNEPQYDIAEIWAKKNSAQASELTNEFTSTMEPNNRLALPEHATTSGVQPAPEVPTPRQLEVQAKLDEAITDQVSDGSVIELTSKASDLTTPDTITGSEATTTTPSDLIEIQDGVKIKKNPNAWKRDLYRDPEYIKTLNTQAKLQREYNNLMSGNVDIDSYIGRSKAPTPRMQKLINEYGENYEKWIADNIDDINAANAVADGPLEAAPKKGLFTRIKDYFAGRKAAKNVSQTQKDFFNDGTTVESFKNNGGTFENGRAIQNGENFSGEIIVKKDLGYTKIKYQDGILTESRTYDNLYDPIKTKKYNYSTDEGVFGTTRKTSIDQENLITNQNTRTVIDKYDGSSTKRITVKKYEDSGYTPTKTNSVRYLDKQQNGTFSTKEIETTTEHLTPNHTVRKDGVTRYENGQLARTSEELTIGMDDGRTIRKISTQYDKNGIKTSQTRDFTFIEYTDKGYNNISSAKIIKTYGPDGKLISRTRE